MSNRRRPHGSIDASNRSQPALGADTPDEPSVLPDFQDLRARLFGEFDVDAQSDDLALLPPLPVQRPGSNGPRPTGIANGALTAADLAAASVDEDPAEDVAEDVADDVAAPSEPTPPVILVEPDAEPTLTEPVELSAPEPEPADRSVVPTSAPVIVDEPSRRPVPVYLALATLVVAALVGGWLLLRGNDDQSAAEPAQTLTASASVRANSAAVTEIDDQSVRTRLQFDFDRPISTLGLVVPRGTSDNGTADFDPDVTDIEISVPGQPTQQIDDDLVPGESISVQLDHPAEDFELSYTAGGTVVRTEPSSAHRAKALVTPLAVTIADGSTVSITVQGDDVLNLGCTDPDATLACGEQIDGGWTVTPASAATTVIAQVDLPD